MLEVSSLTNDPYQEHEVYLPDGQPLGLKIKFQEQQYTWFIEEMTYQNYEFHGLKIVDSINFLYQYSSKLPFGMACFSSNKLGPMFLDDFSSGVSKLYILTADECAGIKTFFTGI